MLDVVQIPSNEIAAIEWTGDYIDYDTQLCRLGSNYDRFILFNPWLEDKSLIHYVNEIPPNYKCIVWVYNGEWVAKFFDSNWTYENGSKVIKIVKPKFTWNKNPNLDRLMTFEDNPFGNFEPDYWDSQYELVWYLDPKVNPTDDKVWAISCRAMGVEVKGIKDMGYVMPEVDIEYSEDLPDLGIDIDQCYPPYWELDKECAWELDPIHTPEKRMWVVKFTPAYRKPKTWEWYGTISPEYHIEYNPDVPRLDYEVDYVMPWHDLAYEHVWYINDQYNTWVFKIYASTDIIGSKDLRIPNPDVVFISYNESNAEENWQRVLEKAPNAIRVDRVKGIFKAHKAAAKLVKTDMFYVVDGDAYIKDNFNFDFQPSLHNRDCTHIWQAKNPINGLVYGYGGVKLFSTKVMRKARSWKTLDLSTTVIDKLKLIDVVSNITAFDTDPKSVWRSTFRECAKLCYNTLLNSKDQQSQNRLDKWLEGNENHQFNKYSIDAAQYAIDWVNKNKDDYDLLQMINSREWLEEQYKSRFNQMEQKYIRLEHSNLEHKNWFVVNWCLGSTCNYACSYCPKDLHDGLKGWPDPNVIKNFILNVKVTHPDKKLYFEFTGGEVTLYKHFIDICKFCTEHDVKVGLISNGSRTIRYWEENKQYFDHVCLSYHPEFAEEKHFVEVAKILHDDVRTHVNIMMSPEKFDHCYSVANKVKNIGNVSMALQPLIHDFGDTLYDYNDFQKKIFDKQHDLITKHIKFTKSFDYYRGAMKKVDADSNGQVSSAHRFISDKTNDWSGWKCYAGVEQLIVDMDGRIFRGWCKVGEEIGHISDENLNLPTEPIVCYKTMCHCNFDIMSTKEK